MESKIENEDFGITIWDSEGLVESMIDLQLRDIVTFLESKFEETFDEEVKLVRDPGARDSQIHCVFYLLDPVRIELNMAATSSRKAIVLGSGCGPTTSTTTTTMMLMMMEGGVSAAAAAAAAQRGEADAFLGGLDAKFDLQALQMLCEKTTVIPVISKADTVTLKQMSYLKWAVWESIRANGLDPFDIINRNSPDNDSSPQSRPPSSPGSFSECRSYSVGDDDDDDDDDNDNDDEVMMMKNRAVGKRQSSRNDGKGKNSSKTNQSSSSSSSSPSSPFSPSSPLSPLSSSSFSSSSATSTPSGTEAGDVFNNNKNNGTLAKHHRLHEPPNSTTTTTTTTYTTTTRPLPPSPHPPPPPPPPPMLPLSIISPDQTYNQGFPGREFPWGAAQTDNPLHCDFSKLKELVFVEWRDEMREASRVLWYERWRTARLGRWNNNDSSMMRVEVGNHNNSSSSRSQIQQHQHHQQRHH